MKKSNDTEKLNFNLEAKEYIPKFGYVTPPDNNPNIVDSKEFNNLLKEIVIEESLVEGEIKDEDLYFPKYKDCECCKGYIYKCKGIACQNMGGICYCKVQDDIENEK